MTPKFKACVVGRMMSEMEKSEKRVSESESLGTKTQMRELVHDLLFSVKSIQ